RSAAGHGNLEQAWSLRVRAAANDPVTIGRPVDRSTNVDRFPCSLEFIAIRSHHVQPHLPVSPEYDGHAPSIRRHSGRLKQRSVRTLPNFLSLASLVAPQTVAGTSGR